MTHVSKRTILLLLAACLLMSLILRYPLIEHERHQTDSYFIHYLSQTIDSDGRSPWLIHPLSYLGYFPFSYPSGTPFVIAELSGMTGLSIEASILVFSTFTGALFCLAAFMLAKEYTSRPELAILATFLAILASRFVDTSYWDGSARAPMVALITLLLPVLTKALSSRQVNTTLIGAIIAFGCFATHHMAVLIVLFGLAYVMNVVHIQYLLRRFNLHKRIVSIAFYSGLTISFVVLSFGMFDVLSSQVLRSFRETSVFSSDIQILSVLVNMGLVYTNQVGFILIFAVMGIPLMFEDRKINLRMFYPLAVLVAFIPMVGNSLYISMIIAPYVAVLGVRYLSVLGKRVRPKVFATLLVILLASSIALPLWSTNRWNGEVFTSGDTVIVEGQTFSDARYLECSGDGVVAITNVNTLSLRLSALSDTRILGSGIPVLVNGDLQGADVRDSVSWASDSFPKNVYRWFTYDEELDVDKVVRSLMLYGVEAVQPSSASIEVQQYFSTHPTLVIAIDNDWPKSFVSTYSSQTAQLPTQLHAAEWYSTTDIEVAPTRLDSYMFYSSEGVSYYLVRLPF